MGTPWLVTAPTIEPLDLASVQDQCHISDDEEDGWFLEQIKAARQWGENETGRAFLTQTWDLKLDAFPSGPIWLPKPPVISITSVTYVDNNGDSQTWSSSLYQTDLPTGPYARRARIVPAYGQSYPDTRDQMNAVTVRFVAGYGSAASSVPENLRHAMRLKVAAWHQERSGVVIGTSIADSRAAENLLWPFKVWE